MRGVAPRQITIAGAGIAGLTAALAFAGRGCEVSVFDRALALEEAGAGLQLSPNATRLLDRLGVVAELKSLAVRPDAVVLRDGKTLTELGRVPLGDAGVKRWGAAYLVAHRADLQKALLNLVTQNPRIALALDAPVAGANAEDGKLSVLVEGGERPTAVSCDFLIGADGVRSAVRRVLRGRRPGTFAAEIAWRRTVAIESAVGNALFGIISPQTVTAFLRPSFHLIAYPVRAGREINLVAFTKAGAGMDDQAVAPAKTQLDRELARCARPLHHLLDGDPEWTCWPIHVVEPAGDWTDARGIALIGDAAHAMTPYAAQGAAMAIEDAVTLAKDTLNADADLPTILGLWERRRRGRITQVLRRAAFNRFAWHAAGPVALARNLVLSARSGESLAADMDWLYGYDATE